MAGYLDRIGAGKVLLDKAPLSYDWVPPSLIGRGEELGEMAAIFSQTPVQWAAKQVGPVGDFFEPPIPVHDVAAAAIEHVIKG